jgi:hypothetical protein
MRNCTDRDVARCRGSGLGGLGAIGPRRPWIHGTVHSTVHCAIHGAIHSTIHGAIHGAIHGTIHGTAALALGRGRSGGGRENDADPFIWLKNGEISPAW